MTDFKRKILFVLFACVSTIFLLYPTSANTLPLTIEPPNIIDIEKTDSVSATGSIEYDIATMTEQDIPMPTDNLENNMNQTNSYFPPNLLIETESKQIIGNDNRRRVTNTTDFPNTTIGQIVITYKNGSQAVGTAWMYGNKVAVTAGHCVYSKADGGWARSVAFYPGKNGSKNPIGVFYATQLYTDKKFVESENSNFDWGMLRFKTNVADKTGYLGAEWTTASQVGTNVIVRGYPAEKNKQGQMWTGSGKITGSGTSKTNYSIDTTGGQSGSPVYRISDEQYRALAIHTNSYKNYNQGERIDKSLFKIITDARQW